MANKLRVFISSTMEDLQNERAAVVRRLQRMGLEPVHAETITPTGGSSWEVIAQRMKECHICLLILGERYGWSPSTGYGAGQGKSVTHLEFDHAISLGIPVLPFMKHFAQKPKRDKRRDDLRKQVSDWDGGHFRQEFSLAEDLAEKVEQALVSMLTDSLRKDLLRKRDEFIQARAGALPLQRPVQPAELSNDKWVLVAGAGMSIAAGYPTAPVLMTAMVQKLWPGGVAQSYGGRYSFSELAEFYEARLGRASLLGLVKALLDMPQNIAPTPAHLDAVRKFKTIVTTNFDGLFELACIMQRIPHQVITPSNESLTVNPNYVSIHKLSGTIEVPESLLLTLSDLDRAVANPTLFGSVRSQLLTRRVVVVGHSLRDEHMQKLLIDRPNAGEGLYVNPYYDHLDEIVLKKFNLKAVKQTADDFLREFQVDSQPDDKA